RSLLPLQPRAVLAEPPAVWPERAEPAAHRRVGGSGPVRGGAADLRGDSGGRRGGQEPPRAAAIGTDGASCRAPDEIRPGRPRFLPPPPPRRRAGGRRPDRGDREMIGGGGRRQPRRPAGWGIALVALFLTLAAPVRAGQPLSASDAAAQAA